MKSYGVFVERADESYGYATITYSTGPTVTVQVTGINAGSNNSWRVKGRASQGDTTTYLTGNGPVTKTFSSVDNKSYIFQILNFGGQWVNTSQLGNAGENSIFNVNFETSGDDDDDDDDGGSSGGGGTTTYDLGIKQVEGVTVKVYKSVSGKFKDMTSSLSQSYQGGVLWYTLEISWGDVFKFEFNVEKGYTLESTGVNGLTYYSSDGTYEFYGSSDPYIVPVVTKNPVSEVPNLPGISTTGKVYAFIDNGSEWIPINT